MAPHVRLGPVIAHAAQLAPLREPPLPLLITGIAGVAGYNALAYFQARYPGQVVGIRQRDNWRLVGEGVEVCDAEDLAGLTRLFEKYEFRSVLNGAGNCALKKCELDPAMAWRINVESVDTLLAAIGRRDVRLVHLSIDLVFSGNGAGRYLEHHATDPVTVYGKTMAAAEERIIAAQPAACILRISLPMGVSFNGHAGAIDWIQSRFKKQAPATLYFDEVRTPTYTDCLNRALEAVLAGDLAGLYHAGGPRALSLYQIAQIVNRIGGYDPDLLHGCPRAAAGPMPPRAGNVSMVTERLIEHLGFVPFDPWPLAEQHVPTHDRWHFDCPSGESGSAELLAQVLYRNPRYGEGEAPAEAEVGGP